MALILTTPIGLNTIAGTVLSDISIPPHSTIIVDSINTSTNNNTIKWVITIQDVITNDTISQEITANTNHSTVSHTRYAIIGTLLPHTINVLLDVTGTIIELEISNPTLHDYLVNITR